MSSLCTSFVNSAEQNSSLDASWVSSFVKLYFAAISLCYSLLAIKKGCYKRVLASSCRYFRSKTRHLFSKRYCGLLNALKGIRTTILSKNDHAYKIAYLKCTLNLNSNSKNEAFSLNRNRENEGQSWYLRPLFWKYFNTSKIITGLKSDATLSVVDRNVAIFTTRHAITR